MAFLYGDAIAEIISAPGTAAFPLGTAATACRLFATAVEADGTAVGNGDTGFYAAFALDANGNPNGGREIGLGTFTTGSPNTLVRTTIFESTNAGAAVNFTGSTRLELVALSRDMFAPMLPTFGQTAVPSTPAEGLRLFSRRRAGRNGLAFVAATGVIRELQHMQGPTALRSAVAAPATASPSILGLTATAIGTNTARTLANTNLFTQFVRTSSISAGTAGSVAGWRFGTHALRGAAAGQGGFFFLCTFAVGAIPTDGRLFVGLNRDTTAIANVDPSTQINTVGVCADSADSNLKVFCNSASLGTPVALGSNFPKSAATDVYEFRMFALPNGSDISWSIENRTTGSFDSGVLTSTLPVNTTILAPQVWINNGATASVADIALGMLLVETPL